MSKAYTFKGRVSALIDYLWNEWINRIPLHSVRSFFYRKRLGSCGRSVSFLMGVELRSAFRVFIGDNVVVNQKVLLDGRGGQLTIGSNVDIAQETNIWTLQHDVHSDTHAAVGGDVTIEDYTWVASRVTILPGVRIGRGAVVACNSVVTKDVPELAIVAGIPARVIGKRSSTLDYKLDYRPLFR